MADQSATIKACVFFVAFLALTLPVTGCQQADDGIPAAEKKNASRLDEMAKTSGGDMEKLSPADREYLVKEMAHGDEKAAKMILGVKAGTLGKRPSVPGGPPGATH